jgi:O-antigen/teichoic acid export membrane protein
VLFQLGYTPIALATGMAMSFIGPILYQRAGDATDHTRNQHVHQICLRMTQFSLIATLFGFATTLAAHKMIFQILVAAKYRDISYLLPWVVLGGGVFAAGQVLATKFLSENKTTELIPVKIVTSLLAVALNVIGAHFYELNGIVAAMVLFSCIHFGWISILIWRSIK